MKSDLSRYRRQGRPASGLQPWVVSLGLPWNPLSSCPWDPTLGCRPSAVLPNALGRLGQSDSLRICFTGLLKNWTSQLWDESSTWSGRNFGFLTHLALLFFCWKRDLDQHVIKYPLWQGKGKNLCSCFVIGLGRQRIVCCRHRRHLLCQRPSPNGQTWDLTDKHHLWELKTVTNQVGLMC